jgi:hypothetical protein
VTSSSGVLQSSELAASIMRMQVWKLRD